MEKIVWTPVDLLQLSGGYWSACALHAGVELDVFSPLAERPHDALELAGRLSCDGRGLAMLLNALAALGLLEKNGESYVASTFAEEFLSRTSPKYLGYIIRHHHLLMAGWSRLEASVRSGGPLGERISHGNDAEARESFEMGMFNLAMQLAPRIVPQIDLTGRHRLLDLGGGPGTYAIHFCQRNAGLTAVVYDLPTTRPFAEETIARFGLTDRIIFADGDFIAQGIEGRFDVAWLSHILHSEDRVGCAVILEKTMASLEPGGVILVQEFILDDAKDGPLFPALFSLNMLLGTPGGQAYSQGELTEMLRTAGAIDVRHLPIELPNGAGVIAGTVPGKS